MILQILRMGVYQIVFLSRIPKSAACDEAVKLAKRYGHAASAGFVNGVLRNVAKQESGFKVLEKDTLKRLSVQYSFPEHIVKIWLEEYGKSECEELMQALNSNAKMSVRVNGLVSGMEAVCAELMKQGISFQESSLTKNVLLLEKGEGIVKSSLFEDGAITVQGEPSMHAVLALDPKPGETVIDLCAAPGGKSAFMADLMENCGEILAYDIHPHRVNLIKRTAERLHAKIVKAKTGDASAASPALFETADKVLADVPCSGFGVIGSKPDLKYNLLDFDELCSLQYKILENASRYVKKNGRVVYSTCTLNKKENQEIIYKFLENNPEFKIEQVLIDEKKQDFITFLPHIHGTEGFFICRLTRK